MQSVNEILGRGGEECGFFSMTDFFLADQVYGDQDMHHVVRQHCMDYMVFVIN